MAGCAAPRPAVDPNIMDKAQAYQQKVQDKMAADAAAEEEAKLVRMDFPAGRPLRLMVAGDSLAAGLFASVQANGFSKVLQAGLGKKGPVDASGYAKAGATAAQAGAALQVPSSIDLAVLELGTNDLVQKTDPTVFGGQYTALLAKVQRDSPEVQILCLSLWQSPASAASAYNSIIKDKCGAAGGKYVDLGGLFVQEANRGPAGVETWTGQSDAFHPNDTGHKAIADLILDRIKFS